MGLNVPPRESPVYPDSRTTSRAFLSVRSPTNEAWRIARQHFDREIQLGGIVTGAYSNVAVLLFLTKQYSELKQIAARPEAKNSIPLDIRRLLALREGRYADYVREALGFHGVTTYGLLGAVLILGAWFVYLQRIEVFEPKPGR